MKTTTKKVAVILCGSGHRDGSEIREAVAVLWALSVEGATVQCFAPDEPQAEVRDHLTGELLPGPPRNMLQEAARIARGQIEPLAKLQPDAFDALVLPGGNGAVKNLADFGAGKVVPDLARAVEAFNAAGKPIGAVCIAPALVGFALAGKQLELTLGGPSEPAARMEQLGHRHVQRGAAECHVDQKNKVITTPAYMIADAPLRDVFEGIRRCVSSTLSLA